MTSAAADIGVIGLAVMGQNLALNLADHGYRVAVYNRTPNRTEEFIRHAAHDKDIVPTYDVPDLVAALRSPRIVLLMIKAGEPVDAQIAALLPVLSPGDVIIDGGNSHFADSQRRCDALSAEGVHFVGAGVSGGEVGARWGPSIMPGGDTSAWPIVEDILTDIAGRAGDEPVADWVGPGGSGHFVKMVHNGIEYGDMQVIAEAYDLMRRGLGMGASEQQQWFERWNEGRLDSYLIEITGEILGHVEPDGAPTLDTILDAAGQKGTGRWTVSASMDQAVPVTLIGEAVYARMVSAIVDERGFAAERLGDDVTLIDEDPKTVIDDLHDALYGSKIVSYTQGFMLIADASERFGWNLDSGTIAGLWRAGCIIRSRFLEDITTAFRTSPNLRNLLLDDHFGTEVESTLPGWRRTVSRAALAGIPVPAYSSALSFLDAYRSRRLPANLIQAQRDYFGAHTYERIDRPRGEWFHTDWSGEGGHITAGTYSA